MKPGKKATVLSPNKKKVKSAENPKESSSLDMYKKLQNDPSSDNILEAVAKSSSSQSKKQSKIDLKEPNL